MNILFKFKELIKGQSNFRSNTLHGTILDAQDTKRDLYVNRPTILLHPLNQINFYHMPWHLRVIFKKNTLVVYIFLMLGDLHNKVAYIMKIS